MPAIRHGFPSGGPLPRAFERAGELVRIEPKNRLISNEAGLAVAAALKGSGLAHDYEGNVEREITEGQLAPILEDWPPPFEGPFLFL